VDRELRVSARNKATHRLRILFAVCGVSIGGALALFSFAPGSQLGVWLFGALKWIAFVFACGAGVFLTSDCLSEEKREGTLGLLFLTDLRGHDVVLGKLLATSLRTFYSLLAIFPVMALSFVLGGVAAVDFKHTLLSLCNTLFFSLALGMFISVICRDPHKAMTGTLTAMLLLLFLPPELDFPGGWGARNPRIGLLSPAFAFMHPTSYHASEFWWSMVWVNLAGWFLLAIASWLAPKTWHEKSFRSSLGARWQALAGVHSRSRKLLDKNAICWLIARDRWTSNLARLAILLILVVFALSVASLFQRTPPVTPASAMTAASSAAMTTTSKNGATVYTYKTASFTGMITNRYFATARSCATIFSLVLEFWLAAQVCRFYVDAKRNGILELLLVAPIKPADIFAGHWLALRRLFLAPAAAQLLLTLTCGAIQLYAAYRTNVSIAPGVSAAPPVSNRDMEILQILAIVLGAINWSIGLITIVWFSMWMGITSKRINIAMLKTFWYAKILPWFGVTLAGGIMLIPTASMFTGRAFWLWPMLIPLLFLVVNIALIAHARSRVQVALCAWTKSSAS
jgi:ABC-type transport system involved in multi-copper enzyme maturation permease subunit